MPPYVSGKHEINNEEIELQARRHLTQLMQFLFRAECTHRTLKGPE